MRKPTMEENNLSTHIKEVGEIIQGLESLGFQPVLVGGMALILLGSQRVTQDFDFVISDPVERLSDVVGLFYKRGMELVSKTDENGQVIRTIDNQKVAKIRLKIDCPNSVYFYNPKTRLRIDLLFDFPILASELAGSANRIKVSSYIISIASEKDLLRLKKIAKSKRSKAGDAEDLIFLKSRKK
ncbi:MAG TPA: hypothetical protein DDW49_05340 [Deltaproteobacteria bacterium]|nr:MAG: hypothetical protein A2048_04320 [Deltaproteobacteria bacterium GWA2_45_12]HBF12800.1 hypothetical protein [Deltaproteobacteria bacterium]